jgi:hypothetical protein
MSKFETVPAPNPYFHFHFYDDPKAEILKVPVVPDLFGRILERVEAAPNEFYMSSWHSKDALLDGTYSCGTTHCIAGWVVVVAGDQGRELERVLTEDTAAAADLICQQSTLGEIPNFYAGRDAALKQLRKFARREADVLASQALDGT